MDDNFPATETKDKLISSFIETTSPSREEAKSFLEAHQWNLDAAVSAFAESNVADAGASNLFNPSDQQNLRILAARNRYSNLRVHIPVSSHSPPGGSSDYVPSLSRLRSRSPSDTSRARFSLISKRAADNPCESEPIKRRELAGNIRASSDISGEAVRDSDEAQECDDGGEQSDEDPSEGEDVDDRASESDVERPVQSSRTTFRIVSDGPLLTHNLTIWRNGFTINDDPLEALDDHFIELVEEMESPREIKVRFRINLIRRQEEDFHESPRPGAPFQGVGRTLAGSDAASTEPPASSDSQLPSADLTVDPAAPTTSIQLRLADGTRLVSRFNTHHTVGDVRDFIDASRPGDSRDYQLLIMAVPVKPLLDLDQTIKDAGIANAVLIQKL